MSAVFYVSSSGLVVGDDRILDRARRQIERHECSAGVRLDNVTLPHAEKISRIVVISNGDGREADIGNLSFRHIGSVASSIVADVVSKHAGR